MFDSDDETTDEVWVSECQSRARRMSDIQWSPLMSMPKMGGFYEAGETVRGLPYSSTKKTNSFIGFDVSFYTFLTALKNPRSVLYTEDLRESPYYSTAAAPYMGTVCSTTVMYMLGIDVPYFTCEITRNPMFEISKRQNVKKLKPCDILYKEGHEFAIYDIIKTLGSIRTIQVLETNQSGTAITDYSLGEFTSRFYGDGLTIYKYAGPINYSTVSRKQHILLNEDFPSHIEYNTEICASKGDKSCYRLNEPVTLNVLSKGGYTSVSLYRDDMLVEEREILADDDVTFTDLPWGKYSAALTGPDAKSSLTHFEILDYCDSIENEGKLRVSFSSKNAMAIYVELCDETELPRYYFALNDSDRKHGYIDIDMTDISDDLFVKVHYEGDYGRIGSQKYSIID